MSILSRLFLVLVLFSSVLLYAENKKFNFVLQWSHQAQFAGYYVALEKGYYKDLNLDVNIIPGGPGIDPLNEVISGKADFGSAMLPTYLGRYPASSNLVLLAQILNRSNLGIVAWKKGKDGQAKILTPADLDGKTVSVWNAFKNPYLCLFEKYKISPNIIPQYYSVSLFLKKGVDACSVALYNEVETLIQSEVSTNDVVFFNFYELGQNIPEDGLYCTRETWKKNPASCQNFVKASLKGWEYTRNHQKETIDIVMKYVEINNLPANRVHMRQMLKVMLDSIYPDQKDQWQVGKLSKKDYLRSIKLLKSKAPKYEHFFVGGKI